MFSDTVRFRLREIFHRIGVRVSLFAVAGAAIAFASGQLGPLLPKNPGIELAAGAVDALLGIIATSMLTVTTFSLSIMVQAYGAATTNATPRASSLLIADATSQNTLATFMGSFLFAITGIIGTSAGLYTDRSRILLFFATLGVLFIIVVQLLRWIDHLTTLGRVSDSIERIEAATLAAAEALAKAPRLEALPLSDAPPMLHAVSAEDTGYVRYIDMTALNDAAAAAGVAMRLAIGPGDFVMAGEPMGWTTAPVEAEALLDCITTGRARSFDQDPRYGLIVLSEVASRALSPAVNDPGTAIDVLRAGGRVFEAMAHAEADPPQRLTHLYAAPFDLAAAYREFFAPIARDGAGIIEVQLTLQDMLARLGRRAGASPAHTEAEAARRVALATLSDPRDRLALGG